MNAPDAADTIRAIFRMLPGGKLRLRKPPTAQIDQSVLRQAFGPAHLLKSTEPATPAPSKPATARGTLRSVPHTPKKK